MRSIVVSSDSYGGPLLAEYCGHWARSRKPVCLKTAQEALDYASRNRFEIAIIGSDLPDMTVSELCDELRQRNPSYVPVFVTEGPELAMEAFQQGAADYLVKPFTQEELSTALDRAERLARRPVGQVQIRTFGHFDVFVNGMPVKFSRQKSKEILAYLVDRWGGFATTQQILADIWEDKAGEKTAMSSFQTSFKALRMDLKKAGIEHILISNRNQKSIDASALDCDYYHLMEGRPSALESFSGQYMAEYSWAEMTNANCIRLKEIYEEKQLNYQHSVESDC